MEKLLVERGRREPPAMLLPPVSGGVLRPALEADEQGRGDAALDRLEGTMVRVS
jgi:hypothetical protein